MSTETLHLYDTYRKSLLLGGDNITTVTLKLALLNTSYAPNQETDEFWDDIYTNEVTGTGYIAGGKLCNQVTVTLVNGLITVDANDPFVWLPEVGGFTDAQTAVLYIDTGVLATSRLIGYSTAFDTPQGNPVNGYSISFNAAGIFTIPR